MGFTSEAYYRNREETSQESSNIIKYGPTYQYNKELYAVANPFFSPKKNRDYYPNQFLMKKIQLNTPEN